MQVFEEVSDVIGPRLAGQTDSITHQRDISPLRQTLYKPGFVVFLVLQLLVQSVQHLLQTSILQLFCTKKLITDL